MSSEEFSSKPTDLDTAIELRKKELNIKYKEIEPYDVFLQNLFKVFNTSLKRPERAVFALIDIYSYYLVFVNLNDKEIHYIKMSYLKKFRVRDPKPEEVIIIRDAVEKHYKEIGLM